MQTIDISLPDSMKQYVDEQVAAGEYGSASEYVRDLVRADQKRKAKAQLEQALLESLGEAELQDADSDFLAALSDKLGNRA